MLGRVFIFQYAELEKQRHCGRNRNCKLPPEVKCLLVEEKPMKRSLSIGDD
jgi:hypothetical protein